MKRTLLTLLLCAALCGCAGKEPSSAAASGGESVRPLPSETHGALQVYSLTNPDTYALRSMGDGLVLLSGSEVTTLTILSGPELTVQGSCVLDFYLPSDDPSLTVGTETLSFYDPAGSQVIVLDKTGHTVKRIAAPGDMTGSPALSADQSTLYYCTADALRAWDLESGIRRTVKQLSYAHQSVTALCWDDSVLCCQVLDGNQTRTLLLDAATGMQLSRQPEDFTLITEEGRFYASFSAGLVPANVFGTSQAEMRSLLPEETGDHTVFLPRSNGAVSIGEAGENAYAITCYDLETGAKGPSLSLNSTLIPSVADGGEQGVYLLIRSPEEGTSSLCRWSVEDGDRVDAGSYVSVYHTALAPDQAGLARLKAKAQQLGAGYGLEILLYDEATAVQPWDYTLVPEHRADVLERELDALAQALGNYPPQVLSATAASFRSFRLCLVRELSGAAGDQSLSTAAGVQFFQEDSAYLALAVGKYARRTLYHEFYHAMQTHLMTHSAALDRWEELNPTGFAYDYDYAANAQRDAGIYLRQGQKAFIDTYSMSFPKEDQARVMEYAMLPGNADLFACPILQQKLSALCQAIREAYDLEDEAETFLWEQYLE